MNLGNLSMGTLFLGLAGLAATLFLLQRLRVRYRERTVITTLFWKEALEEARARVLVRRFKHPWAYLFVLLIGSLLWLGFADLTLQTNGNREHVVLLDGSAGMGRGERFQETVALVNDYVGSLPQAQRQVVFCGGHRRTLLGREENLLLLEERLRDVLPEACPPSADQMVRTLAAHASTSKQLNIVVAGDAPIDQTTLDLLPENVQLLRLAPDATPLVNQGITTLGVNSAASGRWDRLDVLSEVQGNKNTDPKVAAALDGKPANFEVKRSREGNRTRVLLTDVPASGQLLTLRLTASDELSADDTATIRLPVRRLIRVAISGTLDKSVGPVLRADPAVLVTSDRPEVAIRRQGEDLGAGAQALEFVPTAAQKEAVLLHHEANLASEQVLQESFARLGLDEVDAMDLAQRSGRQIAIGATPAAQRGISVWEPLLSEQFNFVQSRSFPLFIAQSVRWLAGVESEPKFFAAGEPVRGVSAAFTNSQNQQLDPVGADFVPPVAGSYRASGGRVIVASLLDASTTTGPAGAPVAPVSSSEVAGFDLAFWLAAAVLLLLLIEWFLFGTGRMP